MTALEKFQQYFGYTDSQLRFLIAIRQMAEVKTADGLFSFAGTKKQIEQKGRCYPQKVPYGQHLRRERKWKYWVVWWLDVPKDVADEMMTATIRGWEYKHRHIMRTLSNEEFAILGLLYRRSNQGTKFTDKGIVYYSPMVGHTPDDFRRIVTGLEAKGMLKFEEYFLTEREPRMRLTPAGIRIVKVNYHLVRDAINEVRVSKGMKKTTLISESK